MRSIDVVVKSDQMKKETKVYPFFDGISMSTHCDPPAPKDYCVPASKIYFSSITGEFHTVDRDEEFLKLSTSSSNSGVRVLFQTDEYLVVIGLKENQFISGDILVGMKSGASIIVDHLDHKKVGDPLITGKFGEIGLVWTIPNDANMKFMTGEREFVLTDQISNADPVHTKASGMFKSHGMSSKQENTVLSTKTIKFGKTNVRQNRTIRRKTTTSVSWDTGWIGVRP